ncbi:MAG: sodium:calcium antiporter [Lautropia sp.]
MPDFGSLSLVANLAIFAASAVVVWIAGVRMVRLVDRLAERTGMGKGFAGALLLGGIVSLTEIATVSSAASTGSPLLALNNLFGSESINLFLLAAADPVAGREALTSFAARPALLFQGVMCIVLLTVAAIAMTVGDRLIFGVGAWSTAILLLGLLGLGLSARYESRKVWTTHERPRSCEDDDGPTDDPARADRKPEPRAPLYPQLIAVGLVILAAGFLLSMTGDALAEQTGLGTSLVGFLLVGISTSLPELSTVTTAIRMKQHEMAIGDILGSNVFNLLLIFLTDVVYDGDAVLNEVGRFEIVAALLAIAMTGVLLLGLLERRDRTLLGMGYDSAAIIAIFLGGVALLFGLR